MKNIRLVLIGEILLFIVIFLLNILIGSWGTSAIIWFIDLPSLLLIALVLFPGLIISAVLLMGRLDDPSTIGPYLAVCFLSGFYAVIIEFLLLPLKLNAERKMNEEMDLGE